VEEGVAFKDLQGSELFIFTDNSVAEAGFYKGNSDNRALFSLVLRLQKLELMGSLKLHIIHTAGHRMVAQGTDGLSRGNYTSGVMAGDHMLSFVPLHQTALERAPSLLSWIQEWVPHLPLEPLSPSVWFTRGHGTVGGTKTIEGAWWPTGGTERWFLWAPAPGAAPCALHQLALSRHKRPHLNLIFVCPRLMTAYWWKKLF